MSRSNDWSLSWNNVATDGPGRVAILGAPSDLGSTSNGTGCADFPDAVRRCMRLAPLEGVVDVGNVLTAGHSAASYADELAQQVTSLYSEKFEHVVLIGGDDSVVAGVVQAVHWLSGQKVVLEHWDAHSDTNTLGEFDHSSWLAAAHEHLDLANSREIGVRDYADHPTLTGKGKNPRVLSIDLDVVDPAYAPGVSVPMPFGRPPIDLRKRVESWEPMPSRPTAFVVTEGNPSRDVNDMTARLAFVLIHQHLVRYLA